MAENLTSGVAPTFKSLKDQLATMLGAESSDDLPQMDSTRLGIYVNQAYRECYAPLDGRRPSWAVANFGIHLKAPEALTGNVVKGSTTISNLSANVDSVYEGSYLRVGSDFRRVALFSGTTAYLTAPWQHASETSASMTLYHSCHRLDREVIDVEGAPEAVGFGPLSAISSPEQEVRTRASYAYDFAPSPGMSGVLPSIKYNGNDFQIDNPLFYYIDNSDLLHSSDSSDLASADATAVRCRFSVYPLPREDVSIRLRANILPTELTNDGDRVRLPGNVTWDIMFPIAQAKLALTDPRYNGDNKEMIRESANEAKMRLNTLSNPQKQKTFRMKRRAGW